jgi:hypothetical protein
VVTGVEGVVVTDESGWLIDKSALVRLGACSEVDAWATRIERGLVRIARLDATVSSGLPNHLGPPQAYLPAGCAPLST